LTQQRGTGADMGQPRDLDLHYKISPRKLLAVTRDGLTFPQFAQA